MVRSTSSNSSVGCSDAVLGGGEADSEMNNNADNDHHHHTVSGTEQLLGSSLFVEALCSRIERLSQYLTARRKESVDRWEQLDPQGPSLVDRSLQHCLNRYLDRLGIHAGDPPLRHGQSIFQSQRRRRRRRRSQAANPLGSSPFKESTDDADDMVPLPSYPAVVVEHRPYHCRVC